MADSSILATLLGNDELSGFRDEVARDNIFAQLAPAIGGVQFNRQGWSPGEQFGTSLAQAFLSTALGKIGQNQISSQVETAAALLPDLYSRPDQVVMPEGINKSAFNILKGRAMLKARAAQALEKERAKEMERTLAQELFGAKLEGVKEKAKIEGKLEGLGQPTDNPFSDALQKFGGDEALARKYIEATNPAFLGDKGGNPVDNLSFVNKQFDDAKAFNSVMAAIPGTTAANAFAGIQTNLRTKIQHMLGREMNGPEQVKLMNALPDWNDTKEQIEDKKMRFAELIKSISKARPETGFDSTGMAPAVAGPAPSIPQPGELFNGEKVLSVRKVS